MAHNKEKELIIEAYNYYKKKEEFNKLIKKHDLLISKNEDIIYLKDNWFIDLKYLTLALFYILGFLSFIGIYFYVNDNIMMLFMLNICFFFCFPFLEYLVDISLLKIKNKTKRKFILFKLKYIKSFREIYFHQKAFFNNDKKQIYALKKHLDKKKPILDEAIQQSDPEKLALSYYSLLGNGIISDKELNIIKMLCGYVGVEQYTALRKYHEREKELNMENNYVQ